MPKTQIWQVEEGLIPEMEKPLGIVMNVEDEYGQTKRAETMEDQIEKKYSKK
jgi:hypothetical protein